MNYFFRPWPVLPVAMIRIGVGASLLCFYLQIAPDFVALFSGLAQWRPSANTADSFYWAMLAGCITSALLVTIGLWTRASLFTLLFFHSLSLLMNPLAFWGWGSMVRHFLILLMLVPAGGMLSADVHWRGRTMVRFMPAWGARIFQWQIAVIYLVCSLWRWDLPEWRNGNFAGLTMLQGNFPRFPLVPWDEWIVALRPLSYASMAWEWLGAALPVLGPLQPVVALLLMGLHLGMEALLRVQYWQVTMIFCLCIYLPPSWWRMESSTAFRPVRWIPTVMIGALAIFVFGAWPVHKLPKGWAGAQAAVNTPLKVLTLERTKYMNMFSILESTTNQCISAFARDADGVEQMIYSNHSDCRAPVRWWRDEVGMVLNRAMKIGSTDFYLTRFMCELSGGRDVRWVHEYKGYSWNEAGTVKWHEPTRFEQTLECPNRPSRRR